MDAFLRENKERLESVRGEASLNVHVVLGNESCDLDSAVSAVVWAYHLGKEQEATGGARWDVILPVLNIPHQDYPLRTEVTHFLSLVNHVGASSLVFRDDLDLHAQHAAGKLTLTLVDHNTLPKADTSLDAAVEEVIDHHSNGRSDGERSIRVTVETVGSCSTLVAEKILAQNPDIVDENIAKLLLGPILVDTVNLSASAGKATAKDIGMVEALSKICPDLNKEEMYGELQQAKADMSDFSVADILRKDFKCVSGTSMSIGMSSIPMHLKEFVEKPDIEIELQNYCASKNLRLLTLMALTVSDDGQAHRQICVYSPDSSDSMKDELVQTLEESTSPELLLSELDINAPGLTVYNQGNVRASRKQVLPLVKDFLNRQEDSSQDEEVVESLATESDLTDMNNTLLKLSNNTNNANEEVHSDNPFAIGDSQAISSPDSSGIDAGSVLLDLDPFSGNQDGMVTSGSGAFSSGDSVDTIGITPSSPSSDAMGFGSGTEDLLGLDTLGSGKESLVEDSSSVNPISNPFADSSKDDIGLDAFMSQPAVSSDPGPNPFDVPPVSNTSNDLFSFDAVTDSQAPEPEATIFVSANNPFADAGDTSSNDLQGLDPFAASSGSGDKLMASNITAVDPFGVMDSTIQASVLSTVESSATDLGEFMNQLPGSPDAVDQQSLDPTSDTHLEVTVGDPGGFPVASSTSNPFAMPGQSEDEPFEIDFFISPSNDLASQPSDDFAAASTNPFEVSEPSPESVTCTDVEPSPMDFNVLADYHPGSPGTALVAEPSNLMTSDPFSDSSATVDGNQACGIPTSEEGSTQNILDLDDFGTVPAEGQAQGLLYPTPEIMVTRTSDNDQETSETDDFDLKSAKKDGFSDGSSPDEGQDQIVGAEVQDRQPAAESVEYDEGFSETDKPELETTDQKDETGRVMPPSFDLGITDDKNTDEDVFDEDEVVASGRSEEVSIELDKEDDAEAKSLSNKELDLMTANLSQGMPQDECLVDDVRFSVEPDQGKKVDQPSENIGLGESLVELQPNESIATTLAGEVEQSLDDSKSEENQEEPLILTFDQNEVVDTHDVDLDVPVIESSGEAVAESSGEAVSEPTKNDRQEATWTYKDQSEEVEETEDAEEQLSANVQEASDEHQKIINDDTQEVQESVGTHTILSEDAVIETVLPDATESKASPVEFETLKDGDTVSFQTADQQESAQGLEYQFTSSEGPETQNEPEFDDLGEKVIDDAGVDVQEMQESVESHVNLSEDVVMELVHPDDEALEVSLPQQEPEKDVETITPITTNLLESVPGTVDEISAPDRASTPDVLPLELAVGGAEASLEQNFSPMSDDTPARSSGITSPDSDFTSDMISDDPSSGDSYIVTDLSHEASNFQIVDIQEEVEAEEDVQVAESKSETETQIKKGTPSEEKEKKMNGIPDVTLPEDFSGDVQVGVIDNYFTKELQTDKKGDMDAIPIPTDVGFANSGRSSPNTVLEKDTLLKEEAQDLVEGIIKMAKFAFLEEEQQKKQTNVEEVSAEALGEQLISEPGEGELIQSSETGGQESAVPSSEVSVNREITNEEKSETPLDSLSRDQDTVQFEAAGEVTLEPPQASVEEEIAQVIVSQEESVVTTNEQLPSQGEPPSATSEGLWEPPKLAVEEEISQVAVLQEESVMTTNKQLPSQGETLSTEGREDEPSDQEVLQEAIHLVEAEVVATSELPAEQEVPLEANRESQEPQVQLDEKAPQNVDPSDELDEVPQSPIEVNVVISKQGLQDVSSKSEEVADQSSAGKTKLLVEDSMKDVDIEFESDNRQTSVFGLADILEYVNADGKVEGSTPETSVRPSTLSLTTKSTPKSGRLLSSGTPISMLSDTGTPLTPISMRSIDLLASDTGTDEDVLDRTQEDEMETEEQEASEKVTPPAAKRCLSIDADVVQDIHGEWDDKKKLMDVIVEKEKQKSLCETAEKTSPQRTMSFATAEAKKHMEGVELPDEWQDDEFSQQKLAGVDSIQEEDSFFKRRVPPKDNKLRSRDSMLSDDGSVEGMSAWADKLAGDDGFDEDDDVEASPLPDDTLQSPGVEPIPEYSAKEEMEDRRNWRKVVIASKEFTLDMRAINPYKKVLSHGGYYGDGVNAIIVLASCYMPDRSRKDYNYIMNNLFLYVISTLELLVANEYMIVYFHGAAPKNRIPSLNWMRKCYQMIDRKLRKNLKGLYIVHPTTWLRAIIRFTRPFISSKFSRKLKFVECLDELPSLVSMEYIYIPDEVRRFDEGRKQKEGGGVALWGQYASMALAVTRCSLYLWCLPAAAQCTLGYPWLVLSDALSWWISSSRRKDGSSEGDSSCYTVGPDSDVATLDEDYINEMLYVPTSRAARHRMSMQLRRGNFALSALQQERAHDFEDWDSHGFMEDDMFADIEDDGEDAEEEGEDLRANAKHKDGEDNNEEEEERDLRHRRSIGDGDLEYEEEIDPFSVLHAPPHQSHPRPNQQHQCSEATTATAKPASSILRRGARRHLKGSGKR